jgi:hypothetical protein
MNSASVALVDGLLRGRLLMSRTAYHFAVEEGVGEMSLDGERV